jgi:hypothetical protein
MLVWLIGSRVTAVFWDPPVGPVVALVGAIVMGVGTALVWGTRLARAARAERQGARRAASGSP